MIRNRATNSDMDSDTAEINLSPLIDCVFILLIFYIVTTVFIEETGVEVNKPEAAASTHLDKTSMLIAISSENRVIYGGTEIGIAGVAGVVKRQMENGEVPVIIQADKQADHGIFSRVYGEAKAAGAEKINFATEF